jgi:hypothetical protein
MRTQKDLEWFGPPERNTLLSLWLRHGYCLRHPFRHSEQVSLKPLVALRRIMCGSCKKGTQEHIKI